MDAILKRLEADSNLRVLCMAWDGSFEFSNGKPIGERNWEALDTAIKSGLLMHDGTDASDNDVYRLAAK